jgi:hypothetical protein
MPASPPPPPLTQTTAPSFSHLNATERRHVALRSRQIFFGAVLLFAAVLVVAFVVSFGPDLSHSQDIPRQARPTLATLVTSLHFNPTLVRSAYDTSKNLQQQPALPKSSVPPAIVAIIMALGPAEIASLVQNMGKALSLHSAKLQANKITGAVILE